MLRFVLKRHVVDHISGMNVVHPFTLDVDVPELERHLTSGGSGENGCDTVQLCCVEVRKGEEADPVEKLVDDINQLSVASLDNQRLYGHERKNSSV